MSSIGDSQEERQPELSCDICHNFAYTDKDQYSRRYSDISRSANSCHACHIIEKATRSFCRLEDLPRLRVVIQRRADRDMLQPLWFLFLGLLIEGKYLCRIRLYKSPDGLCPWPLMKAGPVVPKDTASPASSSWALAQLDECLSHHPECGADSDPASLPTRVLDVGLESASDRDPVRVVETCASQGRYLALSHCWGDPALMATKLTAHTIKEYKESIPYNSLPQTFRDAVTFTRRIGVRYLWIDSLCIIQRDDEKDSEEDRKLPRQDWERESSRMCSVYQNAHLTLAAASATSCTGGLFFQQSTRIEIKGTCIDGPYELIAHEWGNHDQDDFPLMKRAWAYQEYLLSPRTLLFAQNELLWRCRRYTYCQCSPRPPQTSDESWEWFKLSKVNLTRGSNQPKLVNKWHDIVQHYSTASLSYESDRLAAIAGVAGYMRQLRTGDYLAGLWSDSLALDLLWHPIVQSSHNTIPGSDKRLFPTWSWASIKGKVTWWGILDAGDYTTDRVDLIKRVEDKRSAIPPSELRVRGVLVPTSLEAVRRVWRGDYPFNHADYNTYVLRDSTKVGCLRVMESGYRCLSLVLRCVDEERGKYERLGVLSFRASGRFMVPSWWKGREGWQPEEVTVTLV